MAEHPDSQPKVIFAKTLATDPGRIHIALTMSGGFATLTLRQGRKRVEEFPVPGDLSAFDLPFWSLAILRRTFVELIDEDLSVAEQATI